MSITPGKWTARATSAQLGFTKNDKEQIAMELEFLSGPNEGLRSTWYGYFTEKTTDRTLESLLIAGWDGVDIALCDGLGSTEFEAVVENEVYDGKEQTKVQWINRARSGVVLKKQMNDGQRSEFAERMKGRALAMKQKQVQGASAQVSDDDIPF